jgi:hypothetical protein
MPDENNRRVGTATPIAAPASNSQSRMPAGTREDGRERPNRILPISNHPRRYVIRIGPVGREGSLLEHPTA